MRKFYLTDAPIIAVFVCMTAHVGMGMSRMDSEDMVFSYAPGNDRLVFGGIGYVATVYNDMDHPDKSALYVYDLKSEEQSKVFDASNEYVGNPKVSPSGAAIAVQVSQEKGFRNPKLLISSSDGNVLASFPGGRDFTWNPDSRYLAYTTGEAEHTYTLRSTGTWLYDLRLNTTKRIFDKGDYLAWSESDHSLYIWDESDGRRHILRYDPATGKLSQTSHHGINFSPTGRYYHGTRSSGIGSVDVFDAKTNQPFLSQRPKVAKLLQRARIVGWAPQGDVLILEVHRPEFSSDQYPQGTFETVFYDVPNDLARFIPSGSVLGWQQGQAVVHDAGKFSKRSLGTLPMMIDKP